MDFWIVTIIRLIVPLIIFRWPLLGILLSAFIDGEDWHYLNLHTSGDYEFYRVWDKVLDTYYLGIAAFTSWYWKDKIARILSLSAYGFRTIGVLLFSFINNGIFLLIFPNFFEYFFIFYLFYRKVGKKDQLFSDRQSLIIVILALLIPKMLVEYLFHVKGLTSMYQFVNVGSLFKLKGFIKDYINTVVFTLMNISLPAIALVWILKRNKRKIFKKSDLT